MRPTSLVLVVTGIVLALGALLLASFMLPMRSEEVRGPGGNYSIIDQNIWGESLTVSTFGEFNDESANPPFHVQIWESGPYRDRKREGKWILRSKQPIDPGWTAREVWYLHDREVSEDEWDRH